MVNQERRLRMRQAMEARQLDALILRLPENVLLLSGHWPMIGAAYLVFPREGRSVCIVPECYQAEVCDSLADCEAVYYPLGGALDQPAAAVVKELLVQQVKPGWRTIGYEGDFETVAPSWNAAESLVPAASFHRLLKEAFEGKTLVDVTRLMLEERMRKTPYEITRLAIASEVSCFGLEAFEQTVRIGISGVQLAAQVEQAVMVHGTGYRDSVRVRAFAQVTTGAAETAYAHRPNVISTTRPMADGDIAVLELGVVVEGYWADRTRVRIAGHARDEQIRIFETVRKAQEAAVAFVSPGVRARDVDAAARAVIEDAGYGASFPHVTGHGLGFGYHEPAPILGPRSEDVLEEGMFTSVEPGIYTAAHGGVRIEDDVVVTNDGALVLGPYKKALQ
jgi:Xaa-Pro aminopeptidase